MAVEFKISLRGDVDPQFVREFSQAMSQMESCLQGYIDRNSRGRVGVPDPEPEASPPGLSPEAQKLAGPWELVEMTRNNDKEIHAVDTNSHAVVAGSWDGTAVVFDLETWAVSHTLGQMGGLYAVALGRAETCTNLVACAAADGYCHVWETSQGEARQLSKLGDGRPDEVNDVAFHCKQPILASVTEQGVGKIWDMAHQMELRNLPKHPESIYGVSFLGTQAEHQYFVATASFDLKVRLFDMRESKEIFTLTRHAAKAVGTHLIGDGEKGLIGIDFHPEKQILASAGDDGKVVLTDLRMLSGQLDGRVLREFDVQKLPGHEQTEIKRISFAPSGCKLAAGSTKGAFVWDFGQKNVDLADPSSVVEPCQLNVHKATVFDVAWGDTDPEFLVLGSHDGHWSYWVPRPV